MPANFAPTDDHLVGLAQQGDLDAFTALYERYLPSVYNRVRFTIPEPDIEDLTQEVFIAVMKSLRSFRGEARFNTWLQTITRRHIADYYRRRTPADDPVELPQAEEEEDMDEYPRIQPEQPAYNIDDRIVLRQALGKLPENYQEVLLLRFAEGMQFNEIANHQGVSLEATKSLFRRAVASLQRVLEEEPHG